MESCADCRYFAIARCRKRAPIVVVDPTVTSYLRTEAVFPPVAQSDWCGEFSARRARKTGASCGQCFEDVAHCTCPKGTE